MNLPKEIYREILFQCDVDTLDNCRLISKLIEEILTEDSFWVEYCASSSSPYQVLVHRNASIKQLLSRIGNYMVCDYVFWYVIKHHHNPQQIIRNLVKNTSTRGRFEYCDEGIEDSVQKLTRELKYKLYVTLTEYMTEQLHQNLVLARQGERPNRTENVIVYHWITVLETSLSRD